MDAQTISISLEPALVPIMEARARQLDLNRSQYVRRLVRDDLKRALEAKQSPPTPRRPRKPKAA